MKALIFSLAASAMTHGVFAQTCSVPPAKAAQWLSNVQKIHSTRSITQDEVLKPSHKKLPRNMMDTLSSYDWVEVGSYFYEDSVFSAGFGEIKEQYIFSRFDADGTMTEFVGGQDTAVQHAVISNYPFSIPWKMTLKVELGHTWLCWDEADCLRLVSYRDGVLMYDVDDALTELGEMENPLRYRVVCIAIPRSF